MLVLKITMGTMQMFAHASDKKHSFILVYKEFMIKNRTLIPYINNATVVGR